MPKSLDKSKEPVKKEKTCKAEKKVEILFDVVSTLADELVELRKIVDRIRNRMGM